MLEGKGEPTEIGKKGVVEKIHLPHCHCGGMLRPNVVWFGETLNPIILNSISRELQKCDLLIVIGTSGIVYPAAGFAEVVKKTGGIVANFNLERIPSSRSDFYFEGKCGATLPKALGVEHLINEQQKM